MEFESEAKKMKFTEESDPKTCRHYVKRKKRFCKMTLAKGKNYCGEHAAEQVDEIADADKGDRIPCPLDSKHTVYRRNLQKHLRICNARAKDTPAYIVPRINLGPAVDSETDKLKLSDVKPDDLNRLIERIEQFYRKQIAGSIAELYHTHEILAAELSNEDRGHETMKHLVQTSSILGCLQHLGLLANQLSFIDFGSGKGQLSYWLARTIADFHDSNVILLDRASHRHKKDNKLEDRTCVHRIRADIADFDMRRLDLLQSNKNQVVAVSKHLCGVATDLALRCIVQGSQSDSEDMTPVKTRGIFIALCCHHRCEWASYVGKNAFENNGFDRNDFNLMIKMVSWAICGSGMSRERRKIIEERNSLIVTEEAGKEKRREEVVEKGEGMEKLSIERRAEIGKMCKRLLDYCRLRFLQENNFKASLKYYVKSDVTLENVCLIGELAGS